MKNEKRPVGAYVFSKEERDSICLANKELLTLFVDYLKRQNKSANTISVYKSDLEIAFGWCCVHDDNTPFPKWTLEQYQKLYRFLTEELGYQEKHMERRRCALYSLGTFLETELAKRYPKFDKQLIVLGLNPNKLRYPPWNPDSLGHLLHILTTRGELLDLEQACYIALLAYSGKTKTEVLATRVDKIKMRGDRTIDPKFYPYLEAYLQKRDEHYVVAPFLFYDEKQRQKAIDPKLPNLWLFQLGKVLKRPIVVGELREYYKNHAKSQAQIDDERWGIY